MPGSQLVSLEPNGFASGFAQNSVTTGAANAWTATSDNTDASYLTSPGPGIEGSYAFGLDASGLADSVIVQNVSIRIRYEKTSGNVDTQAITLYDPVTKKGTSFHYLVTDAVPTSHSGPLWVSLGGQQITRAVLDRMVIYGAVQPGLRLYQIFVDVNYNEAPTPTFDSPVASDVLGLANPPVSWTYDDPEGDPQSRYHLIVWKQSQLAQILNLNATGVGFESPIMTQANPAAFNTGVVNSTAKSAIVGNPLLNDTEYVFFLRVADQGSGGRFGDWVRVEHVLISVPVPTVPKLTASAYDAARGRVTVTLQGFDNKLSDNQAGAENATSDYVLTNCTAILDTTGSKLWSPPNGPVISTKSLKITASSAATMSAKTPTTSATGVSVTAGKLYVAGGHVFSTVARLGFAQIIWINSANGVISTDTGKSIPTARGIAPAPIFVVATAPAGAVRAIVLVGILAPANGEAHWIDDFFINTTVPSPIAISGTWPGNLVSNTSFETWAGSTSDWNLVTNGAGQTIQFVVGAPPDGTQSLQITKAETALAPPYAEWPDLGNSVPRLPVVAGNVLIVTGRQLAPSGPGVTVELVYQDGTHDQVTITQQATTPWEPFLAAFQIPTGKTSCSVRFLPVAVGANASQATIFIDAINVSFATAAQVTLFTAAGGGSGSPVFGGKNVAPDVAHLSIGAPFAPFYPWTRGGFAAALSFDVQRSIDGGSTWADVRGTAFSRFDYEATPNTRVLYRGRTNSVDPDNGAAVSSDWSDPLVPDPGFEQATSASPSWFGSNVTDPYALHFQPIFGSNVGALTAAGDVADCEVFSLPGWAASIKLRFLARLINVQGATVNVHFLDEKFSFIIFPASSLVLPTTPGDSGWAWYETPSIPVVPLFPATLIRLDGQTAVNGAQPFLALFDAVMVIVQDTAGATQVTDTTEPCAQWLKDPLNPGGNIRVEAEILGLSGAGNASASGIESTSTEAQLVIQPSGRAAPVVVGDVITDETFGSLQFVFESDAQWMAFETLRRAQRTLLLQLPYGDLVGEQHYIRLGDVRTIGRITTLDQIQGQRRRAIIAAREVDVP